MSSVGSFSLDGKVALITGAGRGIGRAIAERYAEAGAAVVCLARTQSQIDEVAEGIKGSGGKAMACVADVTDPAAVDAVVEQTLAEFGRLDILVANAGGAHPMQKVGELAIEDWNRVIALNLDGVHHCCAASLDALEADGGGHIIIMGSGQGHRPTEGMSAYCASKAAIAMYTRVLALEVRTRNITVNELVPGPVRTELLAKLMMRPLEELAQFKIGTEWIKDPEDVADWSLFMASQPTGGASGQLFSMLGRDG